MALLLNIAASFTEVMEPIGSILGSVGAALAGLIVISDIRRGDEDNTEE